MHTTVQLNEAACPVADEVLARLHRASCSEAIEMTRSLSDADRARLAAFCYQRSHLNKAGLAIASTCSCDALVNAAGIVGRVIHDQSRKAVITSGIELDSGPTQRVTLSRSHISLATIDGKRVTL